MLCPECNRPLLPVTINSDTLSMVLDYCAHCGSVWSDPGEVNFLELKDLSPLIRLLPDKPIHMSLPQHVCPRDRHQLVHFQGESIPAHMDIFRCPKCTGIWFPHSTLFAFKKAQDAKLNYFKLWNIPLSSIYAILLPALLLIIIGGSLVATLSGVQKNTDVRIRAEQPISKPLILTPGNDEVLISFSTQKPAITKIKYWLRQDITTEEWVSPGIKSTHTLQLHHLEEGKAYSFQIIIVNAGTPIVSPVYHFTPKE